MKDWFQSLETREQQFISVGAVFVIATLIYVLVWAPMQEKQTQLRKQISTWELALADLRPLAAIISGGSSTAQPNSTRPNTTTPIIAVDQTLRSRGLERYRQNSQPTSSNGIRVTFENVAFDELMVWLGDIDTQHGLSLQSGSFTTSSSSVSGRINATLALERTL